MLKNVDIRWKKIMKYLQVIIVFIFIIIYIYYLNSNNNKLENNIVEFKKLNEKLVKSSVNLVTKKDLDNKLKMLLTKEEYNLLKTDLNKINSRLLSVGETIGNLKGRVTDLEESDYQGPNNNDLQVCNGKLIDIYGYTKKSQKKEILDLNKVPIALAEFNAFKEKPWKYKVYNRKYKITTIVSKNDIGKLSFYNKLEYSIPEKLDKFYHIPLEKSDFIQDSLKRRMFWFNPILDLNIFFGGQINAKDNKDILSTGFDIGISVSSFGEIKPSSLFRLFRFGLGYNMRKESISFSFSPITVNVGEPLPLLTNLYLSPQFAVDSLGDLMLNVGVGVQF